MPWYRYNTFLYASERCPPSVLQALAPFALPASGPVPDLSPTVYRLRKRLISLLPRSASTSIARIKKGVHLARARGRG